MIGDEFGLGSSTGVFEDRRNMRVHASDVMLEPVNYAAAIVFGITLGYVVMFGAALTLHGWVPGSGWGYLALFVGVFAAMICGCVLTLGSRLWHVSAFGYLGLVAAPFGALFGPFVSEVGTENIVVAGAITTAATLLLGLIGLGIKSDLSENGFGDVLTAGLLIFVVVSLFTVKLQLTHPAFYITLACIGIALFALLIIFDFNRAKFIPPTLDNAIDVSMQVFLDSLNMLLRIASLLSKVKKN